MMVTVCQPNAGYDYHAYGHNYCKEVAQKPIDLFRISCEDLAEEKCITVPELVLRHRAGGEVYQPADLPQLPGL